MKNRIREISYGHEEGDVEMDEAFGKIISKLKR